MKNTKCVISVLPLIADALGRKYGVKVIIGGERAYTNGKNIHSRFAPQIRPHNQGSAEYMP